MVIKRTNSIHLFYICDNMNIQTPHCPDGHRVFSRKAVHFAERGADCYDKEKNQAMAESDFLEKSTDFIKLLDYPNHCRYYYFL